MEWEESSCRMFAHIATGPPWRTTFGGYPRDTETATTERRSIATGGVRVVEANANGVRPSGKLVVQLGVNADEAKVIKAYTRPLWGFGTTYLSNALKLLANQQKDGDSPIQMHRYRLRTKDAEKASLKG